MRVHDWSRLDAGTFHHFHHSWIEELQRALNSGVLPQPYYAMAEQHAAGFGPDVLTLGASDDETSVRGSAPSNSLGRGATLIADPPRLTFVAETDMEFYRRKQKVVAVRHASGDRVVAIIEVVSPGNKSSRHAIRSFVEKAADVLDRRIHLLILDLNPPGPRDPQGIHGVIWEEISGQAYAAPAGKPLTLASYESEWTVRAYVEPLAVGDVLIDMPLFLEPGGHVPVPLEGTYGRAVEALPHRWRRVLEGESA